MYEYDSMKNLCFCGKKLLAIFTNFRTFRRYYISMVKYFTGSWNAGKVCAKFLTMVLMNTFMFEVDISQCSITNCECRNKKSFIKKYASKSWLQTDTFVTKYNNSPTVTKYFIHVTGYLHNLGILYNSKSMYKIPEAFRHCMKHYEYHRPLHTLPRDFGLFLLMLCYYLGTYQMTSKRNMFCLFKVNFIQNHIGLGYIREVIIKGLLCSW